ncbi:MAG: RNA 2',3'-cyclic phosphodiesterase [Vicinamibacterales bacterium]
MAVDIDDVTREEIGRISSGVRTRIEARTKASWVRPNRMHLTLHFFGDADAALEQCARMALAEPIAEPSFDLSFQGLGFFPERGSPRVLWLGIRDGIHALRRIHAALSARMGTLTDASQPFTPHLTLARFRERSPRAQYAEIARIPAAAGPSRIDRVTLYESCLSPASLDLRSGRPEVARRAGPTYVPLAEGPLRT